MTSQKHRISSIGRYRSVFLGTGRYDRFPDEKGAVGLGAGDQEFVSAVLDPVQDRAAAIRPVTEALIARMVAAGPKHGLEFV